MFLPKAWNAVNSCIFSVNDKKKVMQVVFFYYFHVSPLVLLGSGQEKPPSPSGSWQRSPFLLPQLIEYSQLYCPVSAPSLNSRADSLFYWLLCSEQSTGCGEGDWACVSTITQRIRWTWTLLYTLNTRWLHTKKASTSLAFFFFNLQTLLMIYTMNTIFNGGTTALSPHTTPKINSDALITTRMPYLVCSSG